MGYEIANGAKHGAPKKKRSGLAKFFIGLFSTIIIIPVVLVAAIYGCFYDGSHKEVPVIESYTKEEMFNELLVDALDDTTSSEHLMKLDLKTKSLNSIINGLIKSDDTLSNIVNAVYIDTANDAFDIVLEVNAYNFFKTKLTISTTYREENVDGVKTIIFAINNIKLGRISGMQKVLDIVKKYVTLPDLSSTFEKAGFRMKVDLDNLSMSYKVDDFCSDITKMVGGDSSDFMKLLNEILLNPDFAIARAITGPRDNSLFSFGMDIDHLRMSENTHGISGYVMPDGYFNDELNYTVTSIKNMLDNEAFTLPSGTTLTQEIDLIAKYIMGGDDLFDTPNAEIERLKSEGVFNGLTIPQYNYNLPENEKLENVMAAKIPAILSSTISVSLTSDEINNSLKTTPATGMIASFARNIAEDTTDNYKINYACTDRIGVIISNEKLFLTINLNLNGYCGHLSLECDKDTDYEEFGKMKFTMGDFRFGDIKTSNEIKEAYSDIVNSALDGEGLNKIISVINGNLYIDLSSVLAEKGITKDNANVTMELVSQTASDAGEFKLTLSPKISL